MIERYISDDALNAREDVLLVPIAAGSREVTEGFARRVFDAFPIAEIELGHRSHGIGEGDILVIGHVNNNPRWVSPYSLALCAIHRHTSEGWASAPEALKSSLDKLAALPYRPGKLTVATAGIPGTGFSGLRGNANPETIKQVLEAHPLQITVYQDNLAGDRAARLEEPIVKGGQLRLPSDMSASLV